MILTATLGAADPYAIHYARASRERALAVQAAAAALVGLLRRLTTGRATAPVA